MAAASLRATYGIIPSPVDASVWIASTRFSVDDHYCYIHYRDDDGWKKTDVALPLKEVLQQIPSPFLLIHRSHAVNPLHLERIERDKRTYRLILTNDVVLPISRHRLNEVLPKVRAYLERG